MKYGNLAFVIIFWILISWIIIPRRNKELFEAEKWMNTGTPGKGIVFTRSVPSPSLQSTWFHDHSGRVIASPIGMDEYSIHEVKDGKIHTYCTDDISEELMKGEKYNFYRTQIYNVQGVWQIEKTEQISQTEKEANFKTPEHVVIRASLDWLGKRKDVLFSDLLDHSSGMLLHTGEDGLVLDSYPKKGPTSRSVARPIETLNSLVPSSKYVSLLSSEEEIVNTMEPTPDPVRVQGLKKKIEEHLEKEGNGVLLSNQNVQLEDLQTKWHRSPNTRLLTHEKGRVEEHRPTKDGAETEEIDPSELQLPEFCVALLFEVTQGSWLVSERLKEGNCKK